MAVIDLRVLDLIGTLTAARLDWLAFELIEGIQAGRRVEASEEMLTSTRRAIADKNQPKARAEPHAVADKLEPIAGDDQIEWAASYVAERLDAALAQLDASVQALDMILSGEGAADNVAKAGSDTGISVVMLDG
jgi:membrane protein involved in colicin uptake